MKPAPFEYHAPQTLVEARRKGKAKALAEQSLAPAMNSQLARQYWWASAVIGPRGPASTH